MKCAVCKYEFEEGIGNKNDWVVLKGDDEFINIEGHFTRIKRYEYKPDEREKVNLYACPKCGTVKIDIF